MDAFFKHAFVSTSEAATISGYTPSHITRLIRLGEIQGHKEDRTWLINRRSLETFLEAIEMRRANRAHSYVPGNVRRALALVRSTAHERTHGHPLPTAFRPDTGIAEGPLGEYFIAFSVAVVILASGTFASQTLFLNRISGGAVSLTGEVSYGFSSVFGNASNVLAENMSIASAHLSSIRTDNYPDTVPIPAYWNQLQTVPQAIGVAVPSAPITDSLHAYDAKDGSIIAVEETAGAHSFAGVQSSALEALAFTEAPIRIGSLLTSGYLATGELGYQAARGILSGYLGLVDRAGGGTLMFASSALTGAERLPLMAYGVTLFVGNTTIHTTHVIIRTESMLAYEPAVLAPHYARTSFVAMNGLSGELLALTTRAPARVEDTFSEIVRAPAHVAPVLSQGTFSAEYRLAVGFVDASRLVSEKYLAVVVGTGNLAYTATSAARVIPSRVEQGFQSTAVALAHGYQLEKKNVLTSELLAQSFPGTANVSFTAAAVLARVFSGK